MALSDDCAHDCWSLWVRVGELSEWMKTNPELVRREKTVLLKAADELNEIVAMLEDRDAA